MHIRVQLPQDGNFHAAIAGVVVRKKPNRQAIVDGARDPESFSAYLYLFTHGIEIIRTY